jgi:hypothetical protein
VLIQTGRKRDERLPQIPTLNELMDEFKTEEMGRRLANVVLASGELGRPYLVPPGIAAERLKVLREAFMKLIVDPGFLTDVKRRGLEVKPSGPTPGGHRTDAETHGEMTFESANLMSKQDEQFLTEFTNTFDL